MPKTKKVMLRDMERYDKAFEQSSIRLMEMTVELALVNQAYSIQFWQDVYLYGLEEAVQILEDQPYLIKKDWWEEVEVTSKMILKSIAKRKPLERLYS